VGGWQADPAQIRKHGQRLEEIAVELHRMPDQLAAGPSGFSATLALERRNRVWQMDRQEMAEAILRASEAMESTAKAYELSDEQFRQ
jgi:hypothetical protein